MRNTRLLNAGNPHGMDGLPLNGRVFCVGGPTVTVRIPLTQGKFTIVDDEDAHFGERNWYALPAKTRWYAAGSAKSRDGKWKTIRLHREILAAPAGMVVDHKNFDTLDNRRSNLRLCTNSQNLMNQRPTRGGSSQYKGVHRQRGRWYATISRRGKTFWLGDFVDEVDAAHAYDDAAIRLHGEFAQPNFSQRRTK